MDYTERLAEARLAVQTHDWPRAVELLKQCVDERFHEPEPALLLGVALANVGDLEGAQHWLHEARTLAPNDARTVALLGQVHQRAGRLDEAEEAYRHALAMDHGCAPARDGLQRLQVHRKQHPSHEVKTRPPWEYGQGDDKG